MKKIYTFLNARALFTLFASSLLTSSAVFGQSTCPYPIVQNFNNTGGSTAGFTGSFTYAAIGTNGFLVRDNIKDFAKYTIVSPTYQLPANASSIGYGFTLSGNAKVDRITVNVQYTAGGEVVTVPINPDINPVYNPQTSTAEVCGSVSFNDLPAFTPGTPFRLLFEIFPANPSGGTTIMFDNFRTNATNSLIPLPVVFTGFDAKSVNGKVQLSWKVAGEENVVRYEVERSADGREFNVIGSVTKTGQSEYAYTDASPLASAFYRVRNVDNDGKFKYTNIVRLVNGKSELLLRAYPQPVQGKLTIQHPSVTRKAVVSISTADGRTVRTLAPANGSLETSVDMSGLQKGMYIIRFDNGDGKVQTMKVLKQ